MIVIVSMVGVSFIPKAKTQVKKPWECLEVGALVKRRKVNDLKMTKGNLTNQGLK